MPRPSELRNPTPLQVVLEREDKELLYKKASEHNISIGALIRALIKYIDYASKIAELEAKVKEYESKLKITTVAYRQGEVYYHRKLDAVCVRGTTNIVDENTLPEHIKEAWDKFRAGEITEQEFREVLK